MIKLPRSDILKVRPHNTCKHLNYPTCMVYDAIAYNYGIDPYGPEPGFCLPSIPTA
jgi:hypothetical protein